MYLTPMPSMMLMACMARIKAQGIRVSIAFSTEERRAIRAAAGKADKSMSRWIRDVAIAAAKRRRECLRT